MAGFVLGFAFAQAAGNIDSQLRQLGYLRIELRQTAENHFFRFGEVNGRRRSCLVDTGWSFTTISTNAAAQLVEPGRILNLQLGRVALTNVPVKTQDLRVNGQRTPYDVVLGCDFLWSNHAVLDCASARLYLRPTEPAADSAARMQAALTNLGYAAVPLQQQQPPALTVKGTLPGEKIELLVDSGARWSCLDASSAQRLKLKPAPAYGRMSGPGAKQARGFAVVEIESLRLGAVPIRPGAFAVLELTDWGLGNQGTVFPQVDGLLGAAELAKSRAVIDCGAATLWLPVR